jgi:UDP-GlcNAc:undecaprenyl-phosphate/decaprenyl-phosphate GlcNAc-1-phosphate transferase
MGTGTISYLLLLVFAVAFMGCVFTTPLVTRLAVWLGAIDHPDNFRRLHKGATPRMGGLGVAFGLAIGITLVAAGGYLKYRPGFFEWVAAHWAIIGASLIVLAVGAVDDARGVGPRLKFLGQTVAVLVLFLGGVQIRNVALLGTTIGLGHPSVWLPIGSGGLEIALPSLLVTMFWFLGCLNVWNLIDGMDGLAAGLGLLVSGTLMLIAIYEDNMGAAIMAAALAGSLAGFLLYNWHPAIIFLGDSGSMLIGLLVGVIGVQYSLKKSSAVSLLFPILAMGLPISDTAMAIFRRWVRNLPLSAADRQHVHHMLIGLGFTTRQAAIFLYCFSAALCGLALLGVAFDREFLALVLGISGCLAFLLILTGSRDGLGSLRSDLLARFTRRRQERFAARVTWEAIQKIEDCTLIDGIWDVLQSTTRTLGCDDLRMTCFRDGREVFQSVSDEVDHAKPSQSLSGPTATFRLLSGEDLVLAVELHHASEPAVAADIAFRFLQRLALATAERLERLLADNPTPASTLADMSGQVVEEPSDALKSTCVNADSSLSADHIPAIGIDTTPWDPFNWLRAAFGWETAQAQRPGSVGDD